MEEKTRKKLVVFIQTRSKNSFQAYSTFSSWSNFTNKDPVLSNMTSKSQAQQNKMQALMRMKMTGAQTDTFTRHGTAQVTKTYILNQVYYYFCNVFSFYRTLFWCINGVILGSLGLIK